MGASGVSKLLPLGRKSVKFMSDGEQRCQITYVDILLWGVLGIHPQALDTNPHTVEKTLVYVTIAS